MAAKTKAEQIIQDNPVAIFSKSYCPVSERTDIAKTGRG